MNSRSETDQVIGLELRACGIDKPASYASFLDAAPVGPLQWAVAAMLTCIMVLDGLDLQLAAFSAPMLMADWELSKSTFAPLLAAALVGMMIGTVIGSWSGDRFGRKPTLVASVALFGVMTVSCAFASGPTSFLVCRLLSGLGFGAAFPVATTMMSEWMPLRARGKAIGIMTIGIPAGGMIGAALAAYVLPRFGWQVLFGGAGLVCALFAVSLLWTLPESPGFLLLKGRQKEVQTLLARATRKPTAVFPERFSMEARPEGQRGILGKGNRRVNIGLWLAVLANSCATFAIGGWLTVILTGLGLPLETALRGPLIVSAPAVLGAISVGWLLNRFGSRLVLLTACFVVVATAVAMGGAASTLSSNTGLMTVFLPCLACGGFCAGVLQAAIYILASQAYESRFRARGIGVTAIVGRLGTIASSFAGSLALTYGHEPGFFGLIAGLAALVAIGTLIFNRHLPRLPAIKFGISNERQVATSAASN